MIDLTELRTDLEKAFPKDHSRAYVGERTRGYLEGKYGLRVGVFYRKEIDSRHLLFAFSMGKMFSAEVPVDYDSLVGHPKTPEKDLEFSIWDREGGMTEVGKVRRREHGALIVSYDRESAIDRIVRAYDIINQNQAKEKVA